MFSDFLLCMDFFNSHTLNLSVFYIFNGNENRMLGAFKSDGFAIFRESLQDRENEVTNSFTIVFFINIYTAIREIVFLENILYKNTSLNDDRTIRGLTDIFLFLVFFVFNISEYFLDDILESDNSINSTMLIEHERNMFMGLLEDGKYTVDGLCRWNLDNFFEIKFV